MSFKHDATIWQLILRKKSHDQVAKNYSVYDINSFPVLLNKHVSITNELDHSLVIYQNCCNQQND